MRRLICAGSVILAFTAIGSAGFASDATNRVNKATDITTNAPIVVTASRAGRTAQEMPANVKVITAQDIQNSGAQDVVGALEDLGGVFFRRNSDNPNLADISMGGFGVNSFGRVLVLVDGQRLNGADQSTLDWLRIPIGTVDRIEVLRGGQTALYGDYAVAGVINIITHQPSDTPMTTLSVMGGSDGTISSHIGHDGSISNVYYTSDADWRQSNGYRQNSKYQNLDLRGSVSKDWTERLSTKVSAFYSDNTCELPGYLTLDQMRQDPRQAETGVTNDTARTTTFGGSVDFSGDIGMDGHLECSIAGTHRAVSTDWYSADYLAQTTLNSVSVTPRYTLDTAIAGYRDRLLVGVDFISDSLHVLTYSDSTRTNKTEDITLNRLSGDGYIQNEFFFTRELSLILGARVGWCRYGFDGEENLPLSATSTDEERTYRQTAFDATFMCHPEATTKLFARVSTLYRDPFLDEMVTVSGVDQNYIYYSGVNPNLKPERGQQVTLGGSTSVAKEWTADLSAYCLNMKDEIQYNQYNGVNGLNENLGQTRRYGIDAALTWQRHGVGLLSCAYDYVDAFFSSSDPNINEYKWRTIPLVPANVVTVRGELDLPFDLTALATVRAVSSQISGDDNANQEPKLPAYGTLDLGLRYHPHQVRNFDILFGVDNVFDHVYANQDYYNSYSGVIGYYPVPGRTWKVGATYRF